MQLALRPTRHRVLHSIGKKPRTNLKLNPFNELTGNTSAQTWLMAQKTNYVKVRKMRCNMESSVTL